MVKPIYEVCLEPLLILNQSLEMHLDCSSKVCLDPRFATLLNQ